MAVGVQSCSEQHQPGTGTGRHLSHIKYSSVWSALVSSAQSDSSQSTAASQGEAAAELPGCQNTAALGSDSAGMRIPSPGREGGKAASHLLAG